MSQTAHDTSLRAAPACSRSAGQDGARRLASCGCVRLCTRRAVSSHDVFQAEGCTMIQRTWLHVASNCHDPEAPDCKLTRRSHLAPVQTRSTLRRPASFRSAQLMLTHRAVRSVAQDLGIVTQASPGLSRSLPQTHTSSTLLVNGQDVASAANTRHDRSLNSSHSREVVFVIRDGTGIRVKHGSARGRA